MTEKGVRRFEVVIAGFGGQGLLTAGKLLADAGAMHYEHVSFLPSYTPQMRTGESECAVTLSDKPITNPTSFYPPAVIAMGVEAKKEYEKRVKPGGMLFIETSVVPDKATRDDIRVFYIPAARLAAELGSPLVSNLILLGAYLEATKVLSLEAMERALEMRFAGTGRRGERLLDLDREALKVGARLAREALEAKGS